jgi:integrase
MCRGEGQGGITLIEHHQRLYNRMRFEEKFRRVCRADHKPLSTERSYWYHAKHFILWLGAKSEDDLRLDATENFREFLADEANRDISASTQDQAFNALRFLFEKVLDVRLGDLSGIPRAKRQEIMVDVPPLDIAKSIVESVAGRPGLVLRTQLGAALRVSDALRIRVKDLDFRRKQIAIQRSKGGKSRLVPMPASLIPALAALVQERSRIQQNDLRAGFGWVHLPGQLAKKYPGQDHSLEWQFIFFSERISTDPQTGNRGRYHILPAVIQRSMASAREKLGLRQHYTPHCLRHATAQFWEREGVPHSDIQRLLGHSDLRTTQRYLLSGRSGIPKGIPTPI